jgi:hypothetical protein
MLFINAISHQRRYKWIFPLVWLLFLASGLIGIFHFKVQSIADVEIAWVNPYYLILLIFGMNVNWFVEIWKWYVVNKSEKLSWQNATKGVLAGVASSMFFPLRTGGFIGKFYFASNISKIILTKHVLICNMSQKLITVAIGLISVVILGKTAVLNTTGWFVVIVAFTLLLAVAYWFRSKVSVVFKQNGWFQIGLSLFRYLVFSCQLVIAFQLFGIQLSPSELLYIPIYWLLISLVPVSFFGGLLVRETVGASVFGLWLGYNEPAIVIALLLLWFINVFVPAIVGYVFWLKSLRKCIL